VHARPCGRAGESAFAHAARRRGHGCTRARGRMRIRARRVQTWTQTWTRTRKRMRTRTHMRAHVHARTTCVLSAITIFSEGRKKGNLCESNSIKKTPLTKQINFPEKTIPVSYCLHGHGPVLGDILHGFDGLE
jgi:hypothetical protein